jgi:hypothetical protein
LAGEVVLALVLLVIVAAAAAAQGQQTILWAFLVVQEQRIKVLRVATHPLLAIVALGAVEPEALEAIAPPTRWVLEA